MSAAIRVEDLAKEYRLGVIGGRTLRDDLHRWWSGMRGKSDPLHRIGDPASERFHGDRFWALRDVNFEVAQGEVLGIIGRNGAGKSTLLKILTRITAPTLGRALMRGRVSSMLEVGTGFHPELTGRENVYLNGAILGMSRSDVDRRFDEIVEFSGIGQYIDTPVKRYSSGMTVRLAFAVAAHLEPEILLIDEVLAVGDLAFQNRCLGKMGQVVNEGRTIVFVSHNMASIRNLCSRTICLEDGKIAIDAATEQSVSYYLNRSVSQTAVLGEDDIQGAVEITKRAPEPTIKINQVALLNTDGHAASAFSTTEDIYVRVRFECFTEVRDLRVFVELLDEDGVPLLITQSLDASEVVQNFYQLQAGSYEAEVVFPANLFGERRFYLTIQLINPRVETLVLSKVLAFETFFSGYNNVTKGKNGEVYFRPQLDWSFRPLVATRARTMLS